MIIQRLKGGSLNNTTLHEDGGVKFIRKSIDLNNNREYGYVRWYSQLKKLQRFAHTGLFPKLLKVEATKDLAYFDIEYLDGYRDIKTILTNDILSHDEIERINNSIWRSFDTLHSSSYPAIKNAGKLYFKEEVLQKYCDAIKYNEFYQYYQHGTFGYNGEIVYGIGSYINELENFFNEVQFETEENIHGNPTLENMMYSFETDKVIFIDPYEESCIDSRLLDYSQVLQCSRSYYGYINDHSVVIDGTSVIFPRAIPENFKILNDIFEDRIDPKYKMIVDVFEATQFIRMLPFKCAAGDIDKAIFFYTHACYLLNKVFR